MFSGGKNNLSNGRNYGVDALRIYSMCMIVVLHILSQGGILEKINGGGYYLVWLLEILAYCATDCYALISGYIRKSSKKYNYQKIGMMWLKVVFYSFGITFLFFLIHREKVSTRDMIESVFPIASNQYWYFTAYVGMFFLIPVLEFLIEKLTKRECTMTVMVLIVVFSVYGTFSKIFGDPFLLGDGYSVAWLCILYFLGAWMKKYNVLERLNRKIAVIGIMASTLFVWGCFCWVPLGGLLVSYISPFILLNAVLFLSIFSRIEIGSFLKKVIAWFAPATFGVYLIHCQKVVFNEYLKNSFTWVTKLNVVLIPITVLLAATIIFLVCTIIEKIRIVMFKIMRLENMSKYIYDQLEKILLESIRITKRIVNK